MPSCDHPLLLWTICRPASLGVGLEFYGMICVPFSDVVSDLFEAVWRCLVNDWKTLLWAHQRRIYILIILLTVALLVDGARHRLRNGWTNPSRVGRRSLSSRVRRHSERCWFLMICKNNYVEVRLSSTLIFDADEKNFRLRARLHPNLSMHQSTRHLKSPHHWRRGECIVWMEISLVWSIVRVCMTEVSGYAPQYEFLWRDQRMLNCGATMNVVFLVSHACLCSLLMLISLLFLMMRFVHDGPDRQIFLLVLNVEDLILVWYADVYWHRGAHNMHIVFLQWVNEYELTSPRSRSWLYS